LRLLEQLIDFMALAASVYHAGPGRKRGGRPAFPPN
jgi:hypothetical protein